MQEFSNEESPVVSCGNVHRDHHDGGLTQGRNRMKVPGETLEGISNLGGKFHNQTCIY